MGNSVNGLKEDCIEMKRKLLKWNIGQKKISKMKHRKKTGKSKKTIMVRITHICVTNLETWLNENSVIAVDRMVFSIIGCWAI